MSEQIPFPRAEHSPEPLEKIVENVHELAKDSENIRLTMHAKERMRDRNVTMRQLLDVLRNGKGIDGPSLDQHGDWRIKLKRYSAGRSVQVVVVVKEDCLEIITTI